MARAKIPSNRTGRVPIHKVRDPRYTKRPYELVVYIQGKRKRSYYSSREEAERAWKAHKRIENRHGNSALEYDRAAHMEYSQAKKLAGSNLSLVDAVKFWHRHHNQLEEAPIVNDAIIAFLQQKLRLGRSQYHHKDLKSRLTIFCTTFGRYRVNSITGNQLLKWLLDIKYEPRTIRNHYMVLLNFFSWCKRRKWIKYSPLEDISSNDLPTIPQKPKGVLTLDQTITIFQWLEERYPQFVAWFALQAFAGIRRAEADRFYWEWLDYSHKRIVLPGWTFHFSSKPEQGTKTRDDWVMQQLPNNLWCWLERYQQPKGHIMDPGDSLLKKIRKEFAKFTDHPISPWPRNALRHTFCTMHISLYESADKTALLLRHQNTRQLYQNYLAKIVPTDEAKEYFNIRPK